MGPSGIRSLCGLYLSICSITIINLCGNLMPLLKESEWNAFWLGDTNIEWNVNAVDNNLVHYIEDCSNHPKTALEIGFGSGVNSYYMHRQGVQVDAIELSRSAVEKAIARYPGPSYKHESILEPSNKKYNFIFDRAVYHMFIPDTLRDSFIQSVYNRMDSESTWLSIVILYGYKRFKDYNIQDAIKPLLPLFNVDYYLGTTELTDGMEPCIIIRSKKK